MKIMIIILFSLLLVSAITIAQEDIPQKESKLNFDLGADIMSRYVWRGIDYGQSPSIQPSMSLSYSAFEFGVWSAYATNGFRIQELDFYLTSNLGELFSVTITDYFFPNEEMSDNKFFEYQNGKTGHVGELILSYNGTKKLPLSIMAGTVLYGNDIIGNYSATDTLNTNLNYSIYIELGYSGSIGKTTFSTFLGITTHNGLYGSDFGVVNLGVTGTRELPLSKTFALPLSCSFIFNPQMQNVFMVFGITL